MDEISAFVQGQKRVHGGCGAVCSVRKDGSACEVQERACNQPMHGPDHRSGNRLRRIDTDQHRNIEPGVISDISAGIEVPDGHIKNRLQLSRPTEAATVFHPLATDHLDQILISPFATVQKEQVQDFRRERRRRADRKGGSRVHPKVGPVVIRTNLINRKVQVPQQHC
jgi:hypothetical protein